MEGDEPQYVEAIVVRDGRIAFAGATGEANGVLEELAAIPVFFPVMTPSSPELSTGNLILSDQKDVRNQISDARPSNREYPIVKTSFLALS